MSNWFAYFDGCTDTFQTEQDAIDWCEQWLEDERGDTWSEESSNIFYGRIVGGTVVTEQRELTDEEKEQWADKDIAFYEQRKIQPFSNDDLESESNEPMYVCICIDRTKSSDTLVFWKANHRGYTTNLEAAGLYSESESESICSSGLHVRMNVNDIRESASRRVVIDRDSSNFHELRKIADQLERPPASNARPVTATTKRGDLA